MHLAAYERTLRARRRSERTIQSYRETIDQVAAHVDGRDVTTLTRADVEGYLADLATRPKRNRRSGHHQNSTPAIRFRVLRAFYNWCVDEDIIDVTPMRKMVEPAVTDAPVPVVHDDELRKLLKACDGKEFVDRRDTAIIRMWCEPGSARVSEMADVALDDFDLRRNLVTLRGKGDKIRVVPFGAKTGQAIDRYLRLRVRHRSAALPAMWLGLRGVMTASGLEQMLARRADLAGIGHVHPHQLRHTAAHAWKVEGGSVEDAMALFGWSSDEMPRRYGASAGVERAQRAARKMSQADRL